MIKRLIQISNLQKSNAVTTSQLHILPLHAFKDLVFSIIVIKHDKIISSLRNSDKYQMIIQVALTKQSSNFRQLE